MDGSAHRALQGLLHEGRGRPDLVEAVQHLGPDLRVAGELPGGRGPNGGWGLSAAPLSRCFQAWRNTGRRSGGRSRTASLAAATQACKAPGLAPCQTTGASCERGVVSWAVTTSGIMPGSAA